MQQVCSLDFLNKLEFGTDILSKDGEVLCLSKDEVTPELILKLYFKDIFVEGNDTDKPKKIKFNEKQAETVAKLSLTLGKIIGYTKSNLEELEIAAYNHKIGDIMFYTNQLEEKNFNELRAESGYNYLVKNKKYSEQIAEVTKLYLENYDSNKFDINKPDLKIPYSHIVAITSYYEQCHSKCNSKDKTLNKMLRIGIKKFNPYLLHKFIDHMKENND